MTLIDHGAQGETRRLDDRDPNRPGIGELVTNWALFNAHYTHGLAAESVAQVLLDRLRAAPEVHLSLPLPSDPRLRTLCAMLQGKPDDDRPLAAWGESLGVSEKTLSRLFLRDTGLTFAPAPVVRWRPAG